MKSLASARRCHRPPLNSMPLSTSLNISANLKPCSCHDPSQVMRHVHIQSRFSFSDWTVRRILKICSHLPAGFVMVWVSIGGFGLTSAINTGAARSRPSKAMASLFTIEVQVFSNSTALLSLGADFIDDFVCPAQFFRPHDPLPLVSPTQPRSPIPKSLRSNVKCQ